MNLHAKRMSPYWYISFFSSFISFCFAFLDLLHAENLITTFARVEITSILSTCSLFPYMVIVIINVFKFFSVSNESDIRQTAYTRLQLLSDTQFCA